MDDDVVTTTRVSSAPASMNSLLAMLSLSLSPTSKVIAKGGGRHHRRGRADDGGAFRCRTCGRAFSTFQALGGHRTSHKRPRVRADGLDLLLGARPGKGTARDDVHRCHTCGTVFPTGQALGGHMRKHRAAFDVAAVSKVVPATMSAESSQEVGDEGHLSCSLIQFI